MNEVKEYQKQISPKTLVFREEKYLEVENFCTVDFIASYLGGSTLNLFINCVDQSRDDDTIFFLNFV